MAAIEGPKHAECIHQKLHFWKFLWTVCSTMQSTVESMMTPGGHLYFRLDIILVKWLSKHTLHTYFSGTKVDSKYAFLHAFFLIFLSCPFKNLSIWPKTYLLLFPDFACFCTPKRCTRVHCLVLKNNRYYVNFFTRMISNFKYKWPPRDDDTDDEHSV